MANLSTLLRDIVDIESVSGNETELASFVETRLRGLTHLDVVRDGDCVVARTMQGRDERVIIAGHLDTVPVAGNLPSRVLQGPDGDVVWGRGTVDMKGGIAVMLALTAELTTPKRDITWIFYDHEEVSSDLNGLGRLSRNRPDLVQGDFAILMEPTSGEIEGGCQGTIRVDIVAEGEAAHSARAWMGRNAIHALAPVLERLAAYEPEEIVVDGLTYREGLNATGISGGLAPNMIPPLATVHVNYRYAPDKDADEAMDRLRGWFPGCRMEVADVSPAARPGLGLPLAREFMAAVGRQARPKYGWTDVARFSALGIPAVNYGPGDPSLAHRDDEACPAADLDLCADGLRRWLKEDRP